MATTWNIADNIRTAIDTREGDWVYVEDGGKRVFIGEVEHTFTDTRTFRISLTAHDLVTAGSDGYMQLRTVLCWIPGRQRWSNKLAKKLVYTVVRPRG